MLLGFKKCTNSILNNKIIVRNIFFSHLDIQSRLVSIVYILCTFGFFSLELIKYRMVPTYLGLNSFINFSILLNRYLNDTYHKLCQTFTKFKIF